MAVDDSGAVVQESTEDQDEAAAKEEEGSWKWEFCPIWRRFPTFYAAQLPDWLKCEECTEDGYTSHLVEY